MDIQPTPISAHLLRAAAAAYRDLGCLPEEGYAAAHATLDATLVAVGIDLAHPAVPDTCLDRAIWLDQLAQAALWAWAGRPMGEAEADPLGPPPPRPAATRVRGTGWVSALQQTRQETREMRAYETTSFGDTTGTTILRRRGCSLFQAAQDYAADHGGRVLTDHGSYAVVWLPLPNRRHTTQTVWK